MEATPRGIDPFMIEALLRSADGVEGVHHLHVWSVSSDMPALSAHLVMAEGIDLHAAQERGVFLRSLLRDEFGVEHTTFEFECHDCEAPSDAHECAPELIEPSGAPC